MCNKLVESLASKDFKSLEKLLEKKFYDKLHS